MQDDTKPELLEIKQGLEEISGMLLEYVPVEKRRAPLALLNEYTRNACFINEI